VASQWKVSRADQDAFALASHQKAIAGQERGEFKDETVPVDVVDRIADLESGKVGVKRRVVSADEGARTDTSVEALGKLRAVFATKGSVTAGNSSQTSDGAGAVLVVSEKVLKQFDLRPLARFVSFAVRGVPPEIMGIGPKEAIPAALKVAGLSHQDMDWIELNEAFAAQALAVMRDLDLDPSKVNPIGGAIALGHPLGATGAVRAATAIHALQRHQLKYAMVTMCIGTGMGAAGIFERM
jgi:acetyl-CoA acyltransferase